uniref:18 kDa Sin3-associated polypeptide n=1 Tax=Oryza meridionalis TaxID=40149 RepID=A0A0E0CE27_9ORYZ
MKRRSSGRGGLGSGTAGAMRRWGGARRRAAGGGEVVVVVAGFGAGRRNRKNPSSARCLRRRTGAVGGLVAMAGRGEMPMRPARPGQPMQYRGPPPMARARVEPVDREKTCPLLLRVFTKVGGHHQNEEFAVRGKEPKDEVQIYTWKDATLRELTDLVKEVALAARKRNARLSFAFVYPDKHGRFVVKEVGSTFSYGHGRGDDAKTLAELGFQIGDYLSVAIY